MYTFSKTITGWGGTDTIIGSDGSDLFYFSSEFGQWGSSVSGGLGDDVFFFKAEDLYANGSSYFNFSGVSVDGGGDVGDVVIFDLRDIFSSSVSISLYDFQASNVEQFVFLTSPDTTHLEVYSGSENLFGLTPIFFPSSLTQFLSTQLNEFGGTSSQVTAAGSPSDDLLPIYYSSYSSPFTYEGWLDPLAPDDSSDDYINAQSGEVDFGYPSAKLYNSFNDRESLVLSVGTVDSDPSLAFVIEGKLTALGNGFLDSSTSLVRFDNLHNIQYQGELYQTGGLLVYEDLNGEHLSVEIDGANTYVLKNPTGSLDFIGIGDADQYGTAANETLLLEFTADYFTSPRGGLDSWINLGSGDFDLLAFNLSEDLRVDFDFGSEGDARSYPSLYVTDNADNSLGYFEVDGVDAFRGSRGGDYVYAGDFAREVYIDGDQGSDVIEGSDYSDFLRGGQGFDEIYGSGGYYTTLQGDIFEDLDGADFYLNAEAVDQVIIGTVDQSDWGGYGYGIYDFELSPEGTSLGGRSSRLQDQIFVSVSAASLADIMAIEVEDAAYIIQNDFDGYSLEVDLYEFDSSSDHRGFEISLTLRSEITGDFWELSYVDEIWATVSVPGNQVIGQVYAGSVDYTVLPQVMQPEVLSSAFVIDSERAYDLEDLYAMVKVIDDLSADVNQAVAEASQAGGYVDAVEDVLDTFYYLSDDGWSSAYDKIDGFYVNPAEKTNAQWAKEALIVLNGELTAEFNSFNQTDVNTVIRIGLEEVRQGVVRPKSVVDRDDTSPSVDRIDLLSDGDNTSDLSPDDSIFTLGNANELIVTGAGRDRIEVLPQIFSGEDGVAFGNQSVGRDIVVSYERWSHPVMDDDTLFLDGVDLNNLNLSRTEQGREGERSLEVKYNVSTPGENGNPGASNVGELVIFKQYDERTSDYAIENLEITFSNGDGSFSQMSFDLGVMVKGGHVSYHSALDAALNAEFPGDIRITNFLSGAYDNSGGGYDDLIYVKSEFDAAHPDGNDIVTPSMLVSDLLVLNNVETVDIGDGVTVDRGVSAHMLVGGTQDDVFFLMAKEFGNDFQSLDPSLNAPGYMNPDSKDEAFIVFHDFDFIHDSVLLDLESSALSGATAEIGQDEYGNTMVTLAIDESADGGPNGSIKMVFAGLNRDSMTTNNEADLLAAIDLSPDPWLDPLYNYV